MLFPWLKSAVLFALVVFLSFGSYLFWVTAQSEKTVVARTSKTFDAADAAIANINTATNQVGSSFSSAATSVSQTEKDIRQTTAQLNESASGLKQTIALINAPCVPGPCGTMADVGKTLNTLRLTSGQIELAANSFDQNESRFYRQEDQLYMDSDGAVKNLNSLLNSPDLTGTLHNLDQTSTDFQTKFHAFLYPPPCKGWKCKIKTGYEVIKIGSSLLEPAYYAWALGTSIHP